MAGITSIHITSPRLERLPGTGATNDILLEDGTSFLMLEDGTSKLLLEANS